MTLLASLLLSALAAFLAAAPAAKVRERIPLPPSGEESEKSETKEISFRSVVLRLQLTDGLRIEHEEPEPVVPAPATPEEQAAVSWPEPVVAPAPAPPRFRDRRAHDLRAGLLNLPPPAPLR